MNTGEHVHVGVYRHVQTYTHTKMTTPCKQRIWLICYQNATDQNSTWHNSNICLVEWN